jgi:hypothetical protein
MKREQERVVEHAFWPSPPCLVRHPRHGLGDVVELDDVEVAPCRDELRDEVDEIPFIEWCRAVRLRADGAEVERSLRRLIVSFGCAHSDIHCRLASMTLRA